jgi:SAM-dependent methyltransferase
VAVISESHSRILISPRFSAQSSPDVSSLKPSQLPLISEVKAKLQRGDYRVEKSLCPCGASEGPIISEVDRYGLPLDFVLCESCGTIRIDPYLDESSLADFYTHFFQQMYGRVPDVESYFLRQSRYGEKVLGVVQDWLQSGSCVYEVGCGAGGALDVFRTSGYLIAGCEYSAELIAAGRERGVNNLYYGSLKDIPPELHGRKADLIYLNHVFEHMNRPLDFLRDCKSRLADGGRIVIIVPDVSRIDSFNVPAGDLLQFLHIAHKYNFSLAGIQRLSAQAGYHVRQLHPDPSIETSHSIMPELWVELVSDTKVSARAERSNHGKKVLNYLKRTEKLYALGLCRAQVAQRINRSKSSIGYNLGRLRRATPAKIVRKIRGSRKEAQKAQK